MPRPTATMTSDVFGWFIKTGRQATVNLVRFQIKKRDPQNTTLKGVIKSKVCGQVLMISSGIEVSFHESQVESVELPADHPAICCPSAEA